jgi:hypothetical protein
MDFFGKIAERKIAEAAKSGVFDDLSGSGRPLKLEDETWIPEDLRAAYRVLKNSGFIPPELELRNEIINLKSLIDTIDDDKERLKKIRELDFKILKLNMTRKKPLNLEDFPVYEDKIIDKMLSS